jgi:hypothetical protein
MARPKKDHTGRVFGKWTVLKYSHTTSYRAVYWLCVCLCGHRRPLAISSLLSGRSTQCRNCAHEQLRKTEEPSL